MGKAKTSYRKLAKLRYGLFSSTLAALSPVKPLFRLALRALTHRRLLLKGNVLPIHQSLGEAEQAALSRDVIAGLIDQSTAVGAMNECLCRKVGGCADYPTDVGCLVLGDAVRSLHPELGRPVDAGEAMALVDRALSLGLTPMVIHMKSDGLLWSLESQRMLTICFCCPCHCLVRQALANRREPTAVRGLPGVAVTIDPDLCTGCGRCRDACYMGALTMAEGRPAIDVNRCVACGRCAMACGQGAAVVRAEGAAAAAPLAREYARQTVQNSVFRA